VVHSLGGDALEGVAESTRQQYADEAERFGEADLLRLLTVAGEAEDDVKNSPQPRLKLETTLLKMAQMRRTADLREVLDKIDRLEQMVEEGTLPESLGGAATADAEGDASSAADRSSEAAPDPAEPTPSYEADPADGADATPPPSSRDEPDASPESTATPAFDGDAPPEEAGPDSDPDDAPPSPAPREPEQQRPEQTDPDADDANVEYDDLFGPPALDDDSASGGDGHTDPSSSSSPAANGSSTDATGPRSSPDDGDDGGAPQATVAEPAVESTAPSAEGLAQQWPQFVQAVKGDRISLGSLLGDTEPVELTDEVLTVAVPKPLHRDTLRDQRRILLEHLTATFEVTVEDVEFVVEASSPDADAPDDADDAPQSPREQLQSLRDTYTSLDVLFTEFGAEPVW
jgi:DNA polymerase-3 subunit gamma/tau